MNIGDNNSQLLSEINMTPFIDVMLVLLIIFMVTAPMMTQGVDVSLPKANSQSLTTDEEPLILSIDKNSKIFIDDYEVSYGYLEEKISRILKKKPDRKVFLKADKSISYGLVVKVMSEVKNAGVENLGMITEPVSKNEKNK